MREKETYREREREREKESHPIVGSQPDHEFGLKADALTFKGPSNVICSKSRIKERLVKVSIMKS